MSKLLSLKNNKNMPHITKAYVQETKKKDKKNFYF